MGILDRLDQPQEWEEWEKKGKEIAQTLPEQIPPEVVEVVQLPTPEVLREVVVDPKTGEIRQAGADRRGKFIEKLKVLAERDLYTFAKVVLGRDYLDPALHIGVCKFLMDVGEKKRKMVLLPREHCKTSLVGHALPIHILIQPKENNLYFPGQDGADQRILMAGESVDRAKDHIRVIESIFESNQLLRAMWSHRCYENPKKEAKKWNDKECIIPRRQEWPDPSVRAVGVDGVVTGAHPSVLVKDDLISLEAANSVTVMRTAIDWHIASRALINDPVALEFMIGTRWAVHDLYEYILDTDPTVDIMIRSVVENGEPIYKKRFTVCEEPKKTDISYLQSHFGTLFPLLYMNSAADPSLVDFSQEDLRTFQFFGDQIVWEWEDRDQVLTERTKKLGQRASSGDSPTDIFLSKRSWQEMIKRKDVRLNSK